MLLASLPWSICTASDQRHGLQTAVVGMVGEVVEEVRSQLEQRVEEEAAKIAAAEAKQMEFFAAVEQATANRVKTSVEFEEQQARLEELTASLDQKWALLAERQREETRGKEAIEEVKADQKLLESVLEESFAKLKNGCFEELHEAHALSQAVLALAPKLHLDESLATALPSVLTKRQRQGFDAVVMQQFEESLRAKFASLAADLQSMEGLAQERIEAVRVAESEAEAAKAAQDQAACELQKRQEACAEATANLEAQRDALSGCMPSVASATLARDAAKGELEQFCDFNIFAFKMLRDRRTRKEGDESARVPPATSVEA